MTDDTERRDDPTRPERAKLFAEALREDRDRWDAQLTRERERQRTAEAAKSTRLRELRLAKEAAEVQAKEKPQRVRSGPKKGSTG